MRLVALGCAHCSHVSFIYYPRLSLTYRIGHRHGLDRIRPTSRVNQRYSRRSGCGVDTLWPTKSPSGPVPKRRSRLWTTSPRPVSRTSLSVSRTVNGGLPLTGITLRGAVSLTGSTTGVRTASLLMLMRRGGRSSSTRLATARTSTGRVTSPDLLVGPRALIDYVSG